MDGIFDPKYKVLDREEKRLSYVCTRTKDGVTDEVTGKTQISSKSTKANIMEGIGKQFDAKDAKAQADADAITALVTQFENDTKEYLESRGE
jgi:hypothetical protein